MIQAKTQKNVTSMTLKNAKYLNVSFGKPRSCQASLTQTNNEMSQISPAIAIMAPQLYHQETN